MKQTADVTKPKLFLLAGTLIIAGAVFLAYIPATRAGFIWDDDFYVTANPLLTAPDGLYRIWFTTDAPSQYFPLTYTTFWLEHKLWGFNPTGYHVVNIAIHIINALLIWAILRRLDIPGAWFASAVFALHPVNVESVAWVTERKNVLMLLFSLLSILCWTEFVCRKASLAVRHPFRDSGLGSPNPDKRHRGGKTYFYIWSMLFCALALFSKATACTLPIALLLILWLRQIPITIRRIEQVIPYFAMGLAIAVLVMWWEKHHQGTGFVNLGLTPADKFIIAGMALWFYLGKVFWPVNLTFISYPRWQIDAGSIAQYAGAAGFCLLIICAWFLRKRLGRGPPTALLFFAGMLFPMLGFFPLYTLVYSFVADHYQYMAIIAPIVLVSSCGAYFYPRFAGIRTIFLPAAGIILLALGGLTYRQCRIYIDSKTLWEDTLSKNPDSWLAQSQLAGILYREGKLEQARTYLNRTIGLASYLQTIHPRAYCDFYSNLAAIDAAQGNLESAAVHYQKSLDIFEGFALTHYRLAEIQVKLGRVEDAKAHLRRAIEIAQAKKADYLAAEVRRRLESLNGAK